MYSPGALNFAVVDVFPSSGSTAGLAFSNVTEPGPRNLLHEMVAGGPCRGRASGGCLPSSVTQTVSGSESLDFTVNVLANPRGGPVNAIPPPDSNFMTGGVFPMPESL